MTVVLSASVLRAGDCLRTSEEINDALSDPANVGKAFDFTGTVQYYYPTENDGWEVTLGGQDGRVEFFSGIEFIQADLKVPALGLLDEIRIQGVLAPLNGKLFPRFSSIERLAKGDVAAIPVVTPNEIYSPGNLYGLFQLRGVVRDAAVDDSDANFIHLNIADADGQAQVMIIQPTFTAAEFHHLIGADVIVRGYCSDNTHGLRRHVGRLLAVAGLENVEVLAPAKDFGDAPNLSELAGALPQAIAGTGCHEVEGTVLASWHDDTFLLKSAAGQVVRVRLQNKQAPAFGTRVRALGLPVTDFYHINLNHANWQSSPLPPQPAEDPKDRSPNELLVNDKGFPQLMIRHHGEVIRLTGIVRYLPETTIRETLLQLEVDGRLIPVDISSAQGLLSRLAIGSRISLAGVCVMTADDWHIDSTDRPPPGFFLVPRSAADLKVLSYPSWWTPRRLFLLFVVFSVLLLATLLWNISINRRARRKGQALAEEQLARISSELKVGERTRLAVELHDALSQTLTGVSMQIDTAAGFVQSKEPALSRCLDLASRTIDSCRLELRNTLWDLRTAALDEPDFNTAIRKTLCQNLTGVALSVRFCVPRQDVPDGLAHAILKIIRELATNALRHGRATSLQIAGTTEGGKLCFSVSDNGKGFDPDTAPGITQGHFGLQGIQERLNRIDGTMQISSEPGAGTRVSVTIPVTPEDNHLV